jgi:hypothetical protein
MTSLDKTHLSLEVVSQEIPSNQEIKLSFDVVPSILGCTDKLCKITPFTEINDANPCTNAITDTYYQSPKTPNTYSVLQLRDITCNKFKDGIQCTLHGLISKIVLTDLPLAQYNLIINNTNCASSTFSKTHGCCEFNFGLNNHNSSMLRVLSNEQGYLDVSRCDKIIITFPRDLILMDTHVFTIYAVNEEPRTMQVFPHNNYSLLQLNHPTDFLDICVSPLTQDKFTVITHISGMNIVHTATTNDYNYRFRIKFYNPDSILLGRQNMYLSNSITQNTINLSHTYDQYVTFINCTPNIITQSYYMTYRYPSRQPMFTN